MDETKLAPGARLCPVCGKPAVVKHRPFCSARCVTIDLGRWLKGDYRISTGETAEGTPRDEAEE